MPLRPDEILREREHRPYPVSDGPWVMLQRWRKLLFAHWRVPHDDLRRVVPEQLALDTFEGETWIAVVPFAMYGVRARLAPPLPWVSAFLELNVRTNVVVDGRPGVYFFSLDAENPLAVEVARRAFHLPYFRAKMRMRDIDGEVRYQSRRTHRGAASANLDVSYRAIRPGGTAKPGTLEHWFIERYFLATVHQGRTITVEIHHAPWTVHPASATFRTNSMTSAAGIELPDEEPHLLVAGNQDVLTWPPRVL